MISELLFINIKKTLKLDAPNLPLQAVLLTNPYQATLEFLHAKSRVGGR